MLDNQRGSILVISVMIMAIMGMVVFALSRVMLRQLDFSRNIDHAMRAYYGAESSMEHALYDARKLDIVQLDESGELVNNVAWERTIVPVQEEVIFPKVLKNNFVQLNLYDPDDPACLSSSTTGIECTWESMKIEWEGDGSMQLTVTEWDTGTVIDLDNESIEEVKYITASGPFILNDLQNNKNYRIKIKALFGDLQNVRSQLFSEDNTLGDIVPIPNFLTITGVGISQKNKQALQVKIPRKAPLSSLFDYVIFSEDDLIKEVQ